MNRPLLVGLTGGIGSGKSTVAKIFQVLGTPVYYADDRGKWLLSNSAGVKKQVIQLFGEESYLSNGTVNREYLADRVFSRAELLAKLNALVHPAVAKDFEVWVELNCQHPYLIKEAALFFENKTYTSLDKIVTVMAPETLRVERVLLRDSHRSREQISQIMDKQVSDSERRDLSDFLIHNHGKNSLIHQVGKIHQELMLLSN